MGLAIHDTLLPDGRTASVYVEDDRIVEIGRRREADVTISGRGKALLPGFVNAHTHAAMTLLRGYADDMALQDWLSTRIWPAEKKLTSEAVYWGTKLACLEMIKSGTTCFNDMYFHMDAAARAVDEMGIRAVLSEGFIDLFDAARAREQWREADRVYRAIAAMGNPRIRPALGPHAIYTVSRASLEEMAAKAKERECLLHIHLSETRAEVESARKDHGKTPVEYLDGLGFLGRNVVAAHAAWVEDAEVPRLADRGVRVVHCPASNMKLAVGRAMPWAAMQAARLPIALGTDGPASSNSLDMFQAMRIAALLQKFASNRATVAAAKEVFEAATIGGARALNIEAGVVREGALADLVLVDLQRPEMTPLHDLVSNLVYAASGSCVDTVICDGRIVMEGGRVPDEGDILEKARLFAARLAGA